MPSGSLWIKFKWLFKEVYKLFSPSYNIAKKNELHSKRIEAIKFFGSIGKLDLFGKGWNDITMFSSKQVVDFKPIIDNLNPILCDDKHKTISNYKFAICFENTALNGYLTEKIIDCFFSGVIPIYLGATNVNDIIPRDSFIDMRNFNDFESLNNYLENLSPSKARQMINFQESTQDAQDAKKYLYDDP